MSLFDSVNQSDWFQAIKTASDAISSTQDSQKMANAPAQQDAVLNNVPVDQQVQNQTQSAQAVGNSLGSVTIAGHKINTLYLVGGLLAVAAVVVAIKK